MAVIEALQINFVKIHPRAQVFEHLRCAVAVGNVAGHQPRRRAFLEDSHRPFAGDQRLVVGADQDFGALAQGVAQQVLPAWRAWGATAARDRAAPARSPNSGSRRSAGRIRACRSCKQRAGIGVVEWFLLDGVALHSRRVAPGNLQLAPLVEANFADPRLALRNAAAMAAGEAAHPVAVDLFVKFALANLFMNDFAQCTHTFNAKCRDGCQLLTF